MQERSTYEGCVLKRFLPTEVKNLHQSAWTPVSIETNQHRYLNNEINLKVSWPALHRSLMLPSPIFIPLVSQAGYQELVNAIIRPPRAKYKTSALGPQEFEFLGKAFKRTDFRLLNERANVLECRCTQRRENGCFLEIDLSSVFFVTFCEQKAEMVRA